MKVRAVIVAALTGGTWWLFSVLTPDAPLTTGSTTLALRNSVEDIGNSTPAVKGALKNARIEADDGNIRSQ